MRLRWRQGSGHSGLVRHGQAGVGTGGLTDLRTSKVSASKLQPTQLFFQQFLTVAFPYNQTFIIHLVQTLLPQLRKLKLREEKGCARVTQWGWWQSKSGSQFAHLSDGQMPFVPPLCPLPPWWGPLQSDMQWLHTPPPGGLPGPAEMCEGPGAKWGRCPCPRCHGLQTHRLLQNMESPRLCQVRE